MRKQCFLFSKWWLFPRLRSATAGCCYQQLKAFVMSLTVIIWRCQQNNGPVLSQSSGLCRVNRQQRNLLMWREMISTWLSQRSLNDHRKNVLLSFTIQLHRCCIRTELLFNITVMETWCSQPEVRRHAASCSSHAVQLQLIKMLWKSQYVQVQYPNHSSF